MILENTHLVDDQNSPHHSERGRSVCLLQMEPQDSFSSVLDAFLHQTKPVFLLLPGSGEAFSRPEHFLELQRFLAEREHPPFLGLIIPSQRSAEMKLAAHYGVLSASSLEQALHSLLSISLPVEAQSTPGIPPAISRRVTEKLSVVEMASAQRTHVSPTKPKKRSYLLGVGSVLLLLIASGIIVPIMLSTPPHPQSGRTSVPLGTLAITSSGQFDPDTTQGYNDIITLSLRSIPAPPKGMSYAIWLMPDQNDDTTPPLLLSMRQVAGPVNFTYTSPDHTNLLTTYSGVRITVQPNSTMPDTPDQNPASWKWQGFIPNTPTPGDENHYSMLSHLRHLLAKDPTLQANRLPGGLAIWMTRNVAKVEEWASAAQGDWHGTQTSSADADQIHKHMLRILEYLDGAFTYTRDVPAGSPWLVDPLAGKIGLLSRLPNQNPPGFLAHVDIHLTGLAGAPGHTSQQQQLAFLIDKAIQKMRVDLLHVHMDAMTLVKMNAQQLRQKGVETIVNEMANLTTEVKSGWLDPNTGENIGGVLWMSSRLQQLATILVN